MMILGGTLALYSLLCRHANLSFIPNDQSDSPSDKMRRSRSHKIKQYLESSRAAKLALFLSTILGTSMVIGDGVLTPCISVLSAVSGIKSLNQDGVVIVSMIILIILFCIQRLGTDKVGYMFAPAIFIWLLLLGGIGMYNLFIHDLGVLRAFNPKYIVDYFRRNGKNGWISLGGVVLCITGTEAMFADLGHFNVSAVQISFSVMVFPALLLAYIGQAAYLTKFPNHIGSTFYKSIPDPLYWPTIVVANVAAVIASQALMTGAFAIVSQSHRLHCFPRVKVVHTSPKHVGQVYIPEINYLLMIACVVVTYGFKTTEKIGNAYGIAVVAVMLITTSLVTLIMLVIWKTRIWIAFSFFVIFSSIELAFFSSVLYKFTQGGYFPLALSLVLVTMMGVWHYVHQQRHVFELKNKVPDTYISDLARNEDIKRIPGIGLLYSELVHGVPLIFPHLISNIRSIHSIFMFVSIESIPISKVAVDEQFLFQQIDLREHRMFRCVVRYGYKDQIEEPDAFERRLVENLKEFIRHENLMFERLLVDDDHTSSTPRKSSSSSSFVSVQESLELEEITEFSSSSSFVSIQESLELQEIIEESLKLQEITEESLELQEITESRVSDASSNWIGRVSVAAGVEEEIEFVKRANEEGLFYLVGEVEVVARRDSSWLKKLVINYAYSFLKKNFREDENMLAIPRTRLLKVGMTYEL